MTSPDQTPQEFDMAALNATTATMTPAQRAAELLLADSVAVGLAAFELGEDTLARGDLTRARRLLTIAARYDAPGAERALADVDVLIDATGTESVRVWELAAALARRQLDSEAAALISHDQLECWAGRSLNRDDLARLDEAIPNSTIPDAISDIVAGMDERDPDRAEEPDPDADRA